MFRTIPLAAVFLVACGAPPDCVSTCGVPLTGSTACDAYNAAEGRALAALAEHVPELAGRDLCSEISAIQEITIEPTVDGTWIERGKVRRAGTWCLAPGLPPHIKLGTDDFERWGSIVHEFGHVLVGCGREHDHPAWAERGFSAAQDSLARKEP